MNRVHRRRRSEHWFHEASGATLNERDARFKTHEKLAGSSLEKCSNDRRLHAIDATYLDYIVRIIEI